MFPNRLLCNRVDLRLDFFTLHSCVNFCLHSSFYSGIHGILLFLRNESGFYRSLVFLYCHAQRLLDDRRPELGLIFMDSLRNRFLDGSRHLGRHFRFHLCLDRLGDFLLDHTPIGIDSSRNLLQRSLIDRCIIQRGNNTIQNTGVVVNCQGRYRKPCFGKLCIGHGQQRGKDLSCAAVQRAAVGVQSIQSAGELGSACLKLGRAAVQGLRSCFQLCRAFRQLVNAGNQIS